MQDIVMAVAFVGYSSVTTSALLPRLWRQQLHVFPCSHPAILNEVQSNGRVCCGSALRALSQILSGLGRLALRVLMDP